MVDGGCFVVLAFIEASQTVMGKSVQGMVRRPRKRMLGVRSAWAAAWRRTLVANIFGSEVVRRSV